MESGHERSIAGRFARCPFLCIAALAAGLLAAGAAAQQESPPSWTNALVRLQSLSPVYSETRRFVAIGPDPRLKLDAVTWADDVASRIEGMLGQPLQFQYREFRLVLRTDTERTNGWVSASEGLSGAWLIQRLVITNYETADMEAVMTELCRLLLSGQTYASPAKDASPWNPAAMRHAAPVPHWLAAGLAQNVYPPGRARNSRLVLDAWQAGTSLSPRAILALAPQRSAATNGAPAAAVTDRVTQAACGVFCAWLLAAPKHGELMAAVLNRLRGGDAVTPEWLAPHLLDGSPTQTLNDGWDGWILQQRRTIFDPGVTTPEALAQLRAELLLYPGLSGIPKSSRSGQVLGLDYLIAERRADWVIPFARAKRNRLQGLAIGRDPRFQAAVQAYGSFLGALCDGAGSRRLRRLLDEANGIEADLTRMHGPATQQPERGNLGKQDAQHEDAPDAGRQDRP